METKFVKAVFDLNCKWEGLLPVYRIYVNDELFVERTWSWSDNYLTEMLQIQAPPGRYQIRLESVGPQLAKFWMSNHEIEYGSAIWIDNKNLEILQ